MNGIWEDTKQNGVLHTQDSWYRPLELRLLVGVLQSRFTYSTLDYSHTHHRTIESEIHTSEVRVELADAIATRIIDLLSDSLASRRITVDLRGTIALRRYQ